MATKKLLLSLSFVFLIGFVSASPVPEIVDPEERVNDTELEITGEDEHDFQFTIINDHDEYAIENLTLDDSDFFELEDDNFTVENNSEKVVEGVYTIEDERSINESVSFTYGYDTVGGIDSGQERDNQTVPYVDFVVDSRFEETSLEVDILSSDDEVELDENAEFLLAVENTGSATAFNVSLEDDELYDVSPETFELESGDVEVVEGNWSLDRPEDDEEATEKTDQTHEREFSFEGENVVDGDFGLEVFVPFEDFTEETTQDDLIETLRELQEFCQKEENEDLPLCGGEVIVDDPDDQVIEEEVVYEANFTEEEREAILSFAGNESSNMDEVAHEMDLLNSRVDSDFSDLQDSIEREEELTRTELEQLNNNMELMIESNENRTQQQQATQQSQIWVGAIVVMFVLFLALSGVLGYFLKPKIEDWRHKGF